MPYLERHKGIFRVRIIVPPALRPFLGRTALVRSTRTGNRAEANDIAVPIIAEFKAMLADAEAKRGSDEIRPYIHHGDPGYAIGNGIRLIRRRGPEPALDDSFWLTHTRPDGSKPEGTTGPASGTYTLAWAYDRWLRAKEGDRSPQTVRMAERHWRAFIASNGLSMLDQVKRRHLLAWRDSLVDAKKDDGTRRHATKSINQRLQLVSAILRAGWRDAEMEQPDLKAITLPEPDGSERGAWTPAEILAALQHLEPRSWAAWVFLISLTTAVRLGEPVAAKVDWYDPAGFIEVPRLATKANKQHCLPIIECLRKPLADYVATRPLDSFLFDAPHPADREVPISNVASKAMNRFFKRNGIDRCFHELRHTWIEEARHSRVERDLWEIISGHSKATVSDRYGGQKPDVLAAANEKICEFLTHDPQLKAAMLRLVC